MKRSRVLAATAGALALGTLVAPFGATAAQTGTTTATFTLTNGSLAITTPAAPIELDESSTANQIRFSGELGNTTVNDTRNSTSGWVAYAKSSSFTNGSGGTISAGNVTIAIDPALGVISQVLSGNAAQVFFSPDADGTTGDRSDATWDDDGNGGTPVVSAGGKIGEVATGTLTSVLTNLGTLLGLSAPSSNNSVVYNPTVTVRVPAGTPSGSYSGVITQTVL